MRIKGEKRFGFWIMLVFTSMLFVFRPAVIHHKVITKVHFGDQFAVPEIQVTPPQYDLSIENSGSNSGLSEYYRLSSVSVFRNRIISAASNFRVVNFFTSGIKYLVRIPIFIRGHALRN